MRPSPDPDDWWASPATPTPTLVAAPQEPDEDWLAAPEDEPSPGTRVGTALAPRTRLLTAAGIGALVLIVLGLTLGGVFSSNAPAPAPPTTAAGTTTAPTTTAAKTPTTPKAAAVVGPTVTINPGASGSETKQLQRALVSLGHDPGPVDGSYGPLTAKGVEQFQRASGLAHDGIFGPKTLAALTLALKRS